MKGPFFDQHTAWGFDSGGAADDRRKRSACGDPKVDAELFFHEGDNAFALATQAIAKAICATCPVRVREVCLDRGMTEPWGVWGGMTAKERRELSPSLGLGINSAATRDPAAKRICQRCREPFELDLTYPHARICWPCAETHPKKDIRRAREAVSS